MIALLFASHLLTAAAADVAAYQAVLADHVDAHGRVDYPAIKAAGALDVYVAQLAGSTEPTARDDRMAFWINAYNALTIDLVADSYPLSSILDLDGGKVWDTRKFTVAGRAVTLNQIEHELLRPLGDPRVHAAVNCASNGCPPLFPTVFAGSTLDVQLDEAARRWARGNAVSIDRSAGRVEFNQIFDWYGEDFVARGATDIPGVDGKPEAAASFVAGYLSADDAAWLRAGGWTAGWITYDWSLNKQ